MSDKLNIYQKLIEVRKAVPYLKKDNQGYQFQYVSSSQTLGILREKMDETGLLLVPSITDKKTSDHKTKKGDHEYFTELTMGYTWVNAENPAETVSCSWGGQGLDSGEKGIGKALTYAEKYFLLKFFNIPTDKDDPDSFQEKVERTKPPVQKTLEALKLDAEKNNASVAAITAWYNKNKGPIVGLDKTDNAYLLSHLSILKAKHNPPSPSTITCPENNKSAVLADCKESECSKDCSEYLKANRG